MSYEFNSWIRTAADGKLALAVLQIRPGEVAEPDELGDGQGWVHRREDGKLLRIDILKPVTLELLLRVAGDDTAAAQILLGIVPAAFVKPSF
jgi:hypothetical protein